jgi:hypothetical protein
MMLHAGRFPTWTLWYLFFLKPTWSSLHSKRQRLKTGCIAAYILQINSRSDPSRTRTGSLWVLSVRSHAGRKMSRDTFLVIHSWANDLPTQSCNNQPYSWRKPGYGFNKHTGLSSQIHFDEILKRLGSLSIVWQWEIYLHCMAPKLCSGVELKMEPCIWHQEIYLDVTSGEPLGCDTRGASKFHHMTGCLPSDFICICGLSWEALQETLKYLSAFAHPGIFD